jgi:hypothetical protein
MLLTNRWMVQLNKPYDHNLFALDEHSRHEIFAACAAVLWLVWTPIACVGG